MTLEAYDAERHHIGLGEDADSLTGLVTVGPTSKERATALFDKPSNVGSVEDLIGSRTHSIWTQDDFSGGEFQQDWSDPAMFSECVGLLPNQLGRSLLTARPLVPYNLNDTLANLDPISADVVDNAIYITFNSLTPAGRVFRYDLSAGTVRQENVATAQLPAGKLITAAAWNLTSSRLWLGTNEPEINTFRWDNAAAQGHRLVFVQRLKAPVYSKDPVTRVSGIHLFGELKFITTRHGEGFMDDNRVWIHVSGVGDDTKWKQVGTLPGDYIESVTYNNAVYFLTRKGDSRTQLSMSQGDNVFPVLDFPYAFRGLAMVEYAGRLFISGVGYDLDGNADHGELYEVNGTSLRLVRTWAGEAGIAEPQSGILAPTRGIDWTDEHLPGTPGTIVEEVDALDGHQIVGVAGSVVRKATLKPGSVWPAPPVPPVGNPGGKPTTRKRVMAAMASLCVCQGFLWMPDSSYSGLEVYDATTDGFFGGPRLRSGDDPDLEFTDLLPVGPTVFAWASHSTDNAKQGWYRNERHTEAGGEYESYFTTSDFHPDPARMKDWSRATVHTRGSAPIALYYSTDGGSSFVQVAADREEVFGDRRETSFDLSVIPESRLIRLRFQFQMEGSVNEPVGELVAFSLSFLVRGENKHRWSFTVNASDAVADLENGMLRQSPAEVTARLWALAARDGNLIYRDTDGADYRVMVGNIRQSQPVLTEDKEAYVSLDLTEV